LASSPASYPETSPLEAEADQDPLELDDVLFEVLGNGQRHVIGAEDDPDDVDIDEGHQSPLHLQVLHLLAMAAHARAEAEAAAREEEDVDPLAEEAVAQEEGDLAEVVSTGHADEADEALALTPLLGSPLHPALSDETSVYTEAWSDMV